MSSSLRPQTHPFPFLLYLEWALLALAMISALTPIPGFRGHSFPLIGMTSILLLGLLGLNLPTQGTWARWGHVVLQVGLILLASGASAFGLRLFPVLYIVLVIRSCFMFGLEGRLITTGTAFILCLVMLQFRTRFIGDRVPGQVRERLRGMVFSLQVNFVLLFGLSLIFVLLLVNALLAERKTQMELRQANEQLRRSAQRIEALAMAQERSRIARDIHDSLGHSLTALNIQLEGAIKLWESDRNRARNFLQEAKRSGSMALQDVRKAVSALRDDPIGDQPFESAIATLTNQFQQATQIQPTCQIELSHPLPRPVEVALYRIVQEALTNSAKYAQATTVSIRITTQAQAVQAQIRDNGSGFMPHQNTTGFGLQSMRERAENLGGLFTLSSAPNQGCQIQVLIPLRDHS